MTDDGRNNLEPQSHWVDRLIGRAPELAKSWGRYPAFVSVITIVAIVAVSTASSGTGLIVLSLVVVALAAPLIARAYSLYD